MVKGVNVSAVQGPVAAIAQAPKKDVAPNSNIAGVVVALAAVGLAAAATANGKQQQSGDSTSPSKGDSTFSSPEAASLTPTPGGAGTSSMSICFSLQQTDAEILMLAVGENHSSTNTAPMIT